MKSKTKLTDVLAGLVDTKTKSKQNLQVLKEKKTADSQKSALEKKRQAKVLKTIAEEKKHIKNEELVKKHEVKNLKPKTATHIEDENLKAVQARKFQMMTQTNREQAPSSPLQMHLVQSESLRIAQEKIGDLEEEILSLREKNESLISAGEVLQEHNESFKSKLEELKLSLNDEKKSFEDEKEILLSAMEEAREQLIRLRNKNQELEKRIASSFHGIRQRENALEGRIEILKMENSAVQKEKDKNILELKKDILKLKSNLENSHKKNHELNVLNSKLKESSRRAISALRATIYNLEGAKLNEETVVSQSKNFKKAS
ncbi:MAG: hypothetical protein OXJ52_09240 [Oligoflexia bacterium]|nr:hypothetical protein [Oligoflexia bacterium]